MPSFRIRHLLAPLALTSALAAACAALPPAPPPGSDVPARGAAAPASSSAAAAGPTAAHEGDAGAAPEDSWPPTVRLTAEPQRIYVEARGEQNRLNFDFALANLSRQALVIREIEVSVIDAKGKLVLRKFIGGNGFRPAIRTLASVELPPLEELTVFNPFVEFAGEVDLHELRYRFLLSSPDGEREIAVDTVVHPTRYASKTAYSLPVKGRVLVHDGHDFYAHHRRVDVRHPAAKQFGIHANFTRYSYDFCTVDEEGRLYRGDGARNEDWFSFGAGVHAPAAGTVVAAHDGAADGVHGEASTFNPEDLLREPMSFTGNHLVIDHGGGEYSLFAHLQKGSLVVHPGDRVAAGQKIAKMGSSGDASLPHLHYELRSGVARDSDGFPSYFDHFRRLLGSTSVEVKRGQVDSGDFLQSL